MRRPNGTWWRSLAIGLLTLPLMSMSCVEVAQRSVINGLFDATTPLLDECLQERLTDAFEASVEL